MAPLLLLALTGAPATAQVVEQSTAGTSTFQPGGNFFLGWTFTTPTGGPWNNITLTIYTTAATPKAPASGPEALGSAFLFTQPYTGTPAGLSGSTPPGFVASSSSLSGGAYVFPASLVLNPNTQYWVYENAPFTQISFSGPASNAGYLAMSATGDFVPPPPALGMNVPNYSIGGSVAAADPSITNVANAASNIGAGLPNSGIAQGAIFIVQGNGLGPANIVFAPSAFQSASLSGTSITVNIGGTIANPLMYYSSSGQIAALLPSNTPTGQGNITVTYNGNSSGSFPITVVTNNLGVFSIDSSGGGPGIVTYADYSLVSPVKAANCGGPDTTCGAANSNDTLTLWATGLGPVNGNDASGAGLGENMPQIPLTLWLGGVQATVTYQGRSGCCIGEDQIIFTVPNNVPTGCAVPLVVQIGSQISNSTVIPVANGSRNCSFVSQEFAPVTSQQITQLVEAGSISAGTIKLNHYSDGGGVFEDDAKFQFIDITGFVPGTQPFIASWVDDQPAGTCVAYPSLNTGFNFPATAATQLSAGSTFTATGPNGSVNLAVGSGSLTEFNNTGSFLVPGAYTVTGGGGTQVGPVSANIAIPAAATMTSPSNNGSATRANGLTVNWTGGAGMLQIEVNSCSPGSCNNGAAAICYVPASLGTFTVPAYVLEALPAGTAAGVVLSSYSEASYTATGLNVGGIQTFSSVSGFGYGWGSGGYTLK